MYKARAKKLAVRHDAADDSNKESSRERLELPDRENGLEKKGPGGLGRACH